MSFDSEVLGNVFKNFEKKELTNFNVDYQCCSMLKTDYMRAVKGIVRNASTAEVLEKSNFFERSESEVKKITESEQEVLDEKKQMISTMIKSRKSSANTGMKQLILIKKLYNKALTELKMNHGSMLTDTDLSRLEIPVELDIDTYIDNSDIVLKKKA